MGKLQKKSRRGQTSPIGPREGTTMLAYFVSAEVAKRPFFRYAPGQAKAG